MVVAGLRGYAQVLRFGETFFIIFKLTQIFHNYASKTYAYLCKPQHRICKS
jgi:hypothetical protein